MEDNGIAASAIVKKAQISGATVISGGSYSTTHLLRFTLDGIPGIQQASTFKIHSASVTTNRYDNASRIDSTNWADNTDWNNWTVNVSGGGSSWGKVLPTLKPSLSSYFDWDFSTTPWSLSIYWYINGLHVLAAGSNLTSNINIDDIVYTDPDGTTKTIPSNKLNNIDI